MKVGIVGHGFVGKALENGIDNSVSILNIDPKLKTSIIDLVPFQPDIVFICVPTPLCEELLSRCQHCTFSDRRNLRT